MLKVKQGPDVTHVLVITHLMKVSKNDT